MNRRSFPRPSLPLTPLPPAEPTATASALPSAPLPTSIGPAPSDTSISSRTPASSTQSSWRPSQPYASTLPAESGPTSSLRPAPQASSSVPPSTDPWHEYAVRIAEAPESGTVRGMFFSEILRQVPALQARHKRRYIPFSKYPLRAYMQLLIDAGRLAHPAKTPDASLRLLGLTTYGTFASSMAGISLFGGVSTNYRRVVDLVPKAYALTVQPGRVEVVSRGEDEALFKLRDLWTFPESYHLGVWQGGLELLGVTGTIEVIRHSWCSVDFHVRWRER